MRLIDADALAKKAYEVAYPVIHGWNDHERGLTLTGIAQLLDESPTIDAVPVVRCRECRWHEDEQPGMVYCPATVGGWVEDDWFCKGGERKGGDGDATN